MTMNKFLCAIALGCLFAACDRETIEVLPEEYQAGGATTVFGFFSDGFEQPCANLNEDEIRRHTDADGVFGSTFVTAPAPVNAGLGPLFNQSSCNSCHVRNGRAGFPSGSDLGGVLLRLSIDGLGTHGEPLDVPSFGGQLQQKAIFGTTPEASVSWSFVEEMRQFADGQSIALRRPVFHIENPHAPLPASFMTSARIAPSVFGLGLLEAIPATELLALEDENDADGDGISGRANRVWDVLAQQTRIGRFGWKAGQPTVLQQTAAAYANDMGVTNPIFVPENETPDIDLETVILGAFYTQSLAVPAPRDLENTDVAAGKVLFNKIGCQKCHVAKHQTAAAEFSFLADQTIFPYTDLLLHDMGNGLADNRPEFEATGKEWRTPPLWGIGLTRLVNQHTELIHDGRARNITEAIEWHDGEANGSRTKFEALTATERAQLVRFIEAL